MAEVGFKRRDDWIQSENEEIASILDEKGYSETLFFDVIDLYEDLGRDIKEDYRFIIQKMKFHSSNHKALMKHVENKKHRYTIAKPQASKIRKDILSSEKESIKDMIDHFRRIICNGKNSAALFAFYMTKDEFKEFDNDLTEEYESTIFDNWNNLHNSILLTGSDAFCIIKIIGDPLQRIYNLNYKMNNKTTLRTNDLLDFGRNKLKIFQKGILTVKESENNFHSRILSAGRHRIVTHEQLGLEKTLPYETLQELNLNLPINWSPKFKEQVKVSQKITHKKVHEMELKPKAESNNNQMKKAHYLGGMEQVKFSKKVHKISMESKPKSDIRNIKPCIIDINKPVKPISSEEINWKFREWRKTYLIQDPIKQLRPLTKDLKKLSLPAQKNNQHQKYIDSKPKVPAPCNSELTSLEQVNDHVYYQHDQLPNNQMEKPYYTNSCHGELTTVPQVNECMQQCNSPVEQVNDQLRNNQMEKPYYTHPCHRELTTVAQVIDHMYYYHKKQYNKSLKAYDWETLNSKLDSSTFLLHNFFNKYKRLIDSHNISEHVPRPQASGYVDKVKWFQDHFFKHFPNVPKWLFRNEEECPPWVIFIAKIPNEFVCPKQYYKQILIADFILFHQKTAIVFGLEEKTVQLVFEAFTKSENADYLNQKSEPYDEDYAFEIWKYCTFKSLVKNNLKRKEEIGKEVTQNPNVLAVIPYISNDVVEYAFIIKLKNGETVMLVTKMLVTKMGDKKYLVGQIHGKISPVQIIKRCFSFLAVSKIVVFRPDIIHFEVNETRIQLFCAAGDTLQLQMYRMDCRLQRCECDFKGLVYYYLYETCSGFRDKMDGEVPDYIIVKICDYWQVFVKDGTGVNFHF